MDVGEALRTARQSAGLTQRQLAARAAVPQSTVARIERGHLVPRLSTLERLLKAADHEVVVRKRPGFGVDRTQMREALRLTPDERLRVAVASAKNLARLLSSARQMSDR